MEKNEKIIEYFKSDKGINELKEMTKNQGNLISKISLKVCPTCKTELRLNDTSYSSIDKHTQINLMCDECGVNYHFCFDENGNKCDLFPWEHTGVGGTGKHDGKSREIRLKEHFS